MRRTSASTLTAIDVVVSVGVDFRQRAVGSESRIVDQHVDHPAADNRDQVLDARLASQIADHQIHVDTGRPLLDTLPHLCQASLVPPGEDQRHASLRQLLGEDRAQPGACTGDDGPAGTDLTFLRHFEPFR